MNDIMKKTGDHWSKKAAENPQKIRWWQSARIIQHINKVVCGEGVSGFSQGLLNIVRSRAKQQIPFKKGISVGGGSGQKEMVLLRHGIIDTFDLYEYSEARIAIGIDIAEKKGLKDRINFIYGDAFELVPQEEQYDFVHWNNSLHHMLNVDKAVEWSKNILRPGGLFYMDDFVGASRFQWPDAQLEFATRIRTVFENSKYLNDPRRVVGSLPTSISRPNMEKLIEDDPSEAADSEGIVDAIYKHFPQAEFKATGGVVYHLVLNDMLNNFDENDDKILLDLLMIIDELYTKLGQTHYGVALAFKEG